MTTVDTLNFVQYKIRSLNINFKQDSGELERIKKLMGEVIYSGDTRGKDPKHAELIRTMRERVLAIETYVHQFEISNLAMYRKLHGAHTSIDNSLKNLIIHIKSGYLDFDEYEDSIPDEEI
jgi:hypothetical protein